MTALPPPLGDFAAWIGLPISAGVATKRATAVLSAASDLVRAYATRVEEWATEAPADVAAIVIQVAARVYLSPSNPNVRSQNVGPFSEGYFDAAANGLTLTASEKALLDRFRTSANGLGTISTTREDPQTGTLYVPTGPPPAGYDFPWYAADGY